MEQLIHSVVVAGCGRLGAYIAGVYSRAGLDVIILDREESAFARLPSDFSGFMITGSAGEFSVLKKAKLYGADLFVAVTNSDTLNIMCAEIAMKHFNVPKVFACVYEPSLEEFCHSLGVFAVSPITATTDRFLVEINSVERELIEAST
jgi:trk system potassium uptake protein TrkA